MRLGRAFARSLPVVDLVRNAADLLVPRPLVARRAESRRIWAGLEEALAESDGTGRPSGVCFEVPAGRGVLFDELSTVAYTMKAACRAHMGLIFGSQRKPGRVDSHRLSKLDCALVRGVVLETLARPDALIRRVTKAPDRKARALRRRKKT